MKKVAMIMLDGCRYDLGCENLGYMMHLVEKHQASLFKVESELPSLSRPCYEVLLTGTPAYINGITDNSIVRRSNQISIFDLVKAHGGISAAASYHWISQLYNNPDFNLASDRFQTDLNQAIQYGIYYDDIYPDKCLLADSYYLARKYQPNFLFTLPMSVDDYGHRYTSDSSEYREMIAKADSALAQFIPLLQAEGYDILLTADHGMDEFGHHGGTRHEVRDVPLFLISSNVQPGDFSSQSIPQLMIAPLVCNLLDLPVSPAMIELALPDK
ncbi:alkaline phosphatase family protein [Lapidilactobacillus luobeiensis]|uniref:alkaline phosphatase family protein n=1 Tax=Lapidilactobacillus luobeiensis TaxID=2950371 RepID=UPI0021C2E984|nr:alkaline phosphatase family protein [Lapidilactobacillus luobeiensis]